MDNGKKIQTINFRSGRDPLRIEAETLKEAVEKAERNRIDLSDSELIGINLRGSDLSDSDLSGSDLANAVLAPRAIDGAKRDGKIIRKVVTVGPLGRSERMTNLLIYIDGSVEIICGCFSGDLCAFRAKVKETHGDGRFAAGYTALADFFESLVKTYTKVEVEA